MLNGLYIWIVMQNIWNGSGRSRTLGLKMRLIITYILLIKIRMLVNARKSDTQSKL